MPRCALAQGFGVGLVQAEFEFGFHVGVDSQPQSKRAK
jgi:hypothetical protein